MRGGKRPESWCLIRRLLRYVEAQPGCRQQDALVHAGMDVSYVREWVGAEDVTEGQLRYQAAVAARKSAWRAVAKGLLLKVSNGEKGALKRVELRLTDRGRAWLEVHG